MARYICNVVQEFHYQEVEVEADNINAARKIAEEKSFGAMPTHTRLEVFVSSPVKDDKQKTDYPESEEG